MSEMGDEFEDVPESFYDLTNEKLEKSEKIDARFITWFMHCFRSFGLLAPPPLQIDDRLKQKKK